MPRPSTDARGGSITLQIEESEDFTIGKRGITPVPGVTRVMSQQEIDRAIQQIRKGVDLHNWQATRAQQIVEAALKKFSRPWADKAWSVAQGVGKAIAKGAIFNPMTIWGTIEQIKGVGDAIEAGDIKQTIYGILPITGTPEGLYQGWDKTIQAWNDGDWEAFGEHGYSSVINTGALVLGGLSTLPGLRGRGVAVLSESESLGSTLLDEARGIGPSSRMTAPELVVRPPKLPPNTVTATRRTIQRHKPSEPEVRYRDRSVDSSDELSPDIRTRQGINEAQIDQERATVRHQNLPKSRQTKTTSVTETEIAPGARRRTTKISGWAEIPERSSKAKPENVAEHSKRIGHVLTPDKVKDQVAKGGFKGKFNASHAEKQQIVARPNEPVGVSRAMCADCINFFKSEAKYQGKSQIVSDPSVTRVFDPDGTITEHWKNGTTVRIEADGRTVKVQP